MKFDAKIGISGQYKIELIENNKVIHETGLIDNLVTDYGLSYTQFLYNGYDRYICIGSGITTEPAFTDLNLGNEVAISGSFIFGNHTVMNSSSPWIVRREATQDITGFEADISEVGVRRSSVGTLCSRTIIKDENGIPYTISVSAEQTLRVTYYVYLTFSDEQSTGTLVSDDFGTVGYKVMRLYNSGPPTATYRDYYAGDFTEPFGQYSSSLKAVAYSGDSTSSSSFYSLRMYPSTSGASQSITCGASFSASESDRTVKMVRFGEVGFVFDTAITISANHDFKIGIKVGWGRDL